MRGFQPKFIDGICQNSWYEVIYSEAKTGHSQPYSNYNYNRITNNVTKKFWK